MVETSIRFHPSRVDGLPDVSEVVLRPDRLELLSSGRWVVHRFEDIARWPRPAWIWRFLYRHGYRPRWLPVGRRDWFHKPRDRFFIFYTTPEITVFMIDEERQQVGYRDSLFRRIQDVMLLGGFHTYDMG